VALAALHWANNETGVLQPVEDAGRACREAGVPFLIDAVQAAGRLPIDPRKVFADLIAISGHKLGGPQGTGALVVRRGISLAPLIGGNQETRRRGGTPGVPALVGFGAAAAAALSNMNDESKRILRWRAKIETRLRELYPTIRFHGQASPRLPNTVNFALPGIPGETLAIALDLAGVAISTGSACASGGVEPSHVIRAMGFDEGEARSAVRVSLGWSNSTSEINRFLEIFPRVIQQVRKGLKEPR
jgi:cysteine desulfurase